MPRYATARRRALPTHTPPAVELCVCAGCIVTAFSRPCAFPRGVSARPSTSARSMSMFRRICANHHSCMSSQVRPVLSPTGMQLAPRSTIISPSHDFSRAAYRSSRLRSHAYPFLSREEAHGGKRPRWSITPLAIPRPSTSSSVCALIPLSTHVGSFAAESTLIDPSQRVQIGGMEHRCTRHLEGDVPSSLRDIAVAAAIHGRQRQTL